MNSYSHFRDDKTEKTKGYCPGLYVQEIGISSPYPLTQVHIVTDIPIKYILWS